jgi:hypothetical protein
VDKSIASAQFRTQLFDPADLENVKKIQDQYRAQPLSAFLGKSAPKAAPVIDFPRPLSPEAEETSLEFFSLLNFGLQFCPVVPSEKELMKRFAKIGVGGGKPFDASSLSPEMRQALGGGIADAWTTWKEFKRTQVDTGRVTSGDAFGTREFLHGDYLLRFGGALLGIYGLSKEEAMYPGYFIDSAKQKLDGTNRYTLRFAAGELPPVNAFWSLTMYDLPARLLYANSINRYLINSPMLPKLKRDSDGGITLYIQNESPGPDKESNWLPAPKGPFFMVLRLYWPKPEALDGKWKAPPLEQTK